MRRHADRLRHGFGGHGHRDGRRHDHDRQREPQHHRQANASGNTSDLSSALAATIDATPPAGLASTPPNTAQVGQLYSFDADSPDEGQTGIVYSLADAPDGMTINAPTGAIQWTPTTSQAVPQLFTIRVTDAAGNVAAQTVDMTVYGAIPAAADEYTVVEDSTLTATAASGVLANDGDEDSGTLSAELVGQPSHGTLTFNADGSFAYTPTGDFHGTDSFHPATP